MAETSLHPPDDVYGEYATANGFDVSKDGMEPPFEGLPPDPSLGFDLETDVLLVAEIVDVGVLRDVVHP